MYIFLKGCAISRVASLTSLPRVQTTVLYCVEGSDAYIKEQATLNNKLH